MTEKVCIGVVGYGFGGRFFHAPLVHAAEGCTLAGVMTSSPARRAEVEHDFPGTPCFATLAEMKAAGIEAVAISTPAATHGPLTVEAAALGLHVACDKPFAMNAAEARASVAAASAAGVVLSPYQNRRWDSDILTLKRLMADGSLGNISRFESRFERAERGIAPPPAGGGILRDFGSHLFDQALYLFGPVTSVYAEVNVSGLHGDDDHAFFAALTHASGVSSHLTGNWWQPAPGPRYRVTGSTGTLIIQGEDTQHERLVSFSNPAKEGDRWGAEPEANWGRIHRGVTSEVCPSERGRWDTYYPTFAQAVRGVGPAPVDAADAVASLTLIDAAFTSSNEKSTVQIG
jgi:predicted dehydrogenase